MFPSRPFAEQHRIVAKVDELMALCDQLEEARTAREDTRDQFTKASLTRLSAADVDVPTFRSHARFAVEALPALTARADQVKHLRQTILNLAVRGKLVEQDPADEPASELLKRVAAQKARLVREGQIRKPKRLEVVDEPSYDLPAGWSFVALGNVVVKHLGGGTPSKSNGKYWGGSVRWASVKDVGKSKHLDDTIDRITEVGLENSSSNLIEPGNLLVVTRMGLGKVSINRVAVAINQDLRALILSDVISVDYVYNFFLTHSFEGTGLTVKGIKLKELLSIPFPLPPLAEMHRIVAKVDELMLFCDRLEASISGAADIRHRLLESLLHDALASAVHDPEAARRLEA